LGDENENAEIYVQYCNATDAGISCDPEAGYSIALIRNSTYFEKTVSTLSSPDDPGDILRVKISVIDSDGVTTAIYPPQFITLMKHIYRSVGPGNSDLLASGQSVGALHVSNSFASFSSPLSENIGIGDVVLYDSNDDGVLDNLAVIYGRLSSSLFVVKNSLGNLAIPTNTDDSDWAIYRSYTSLYNAERGTINSSISIPMDNDAYWTVGGGRNILSAGEIWNIVCYGDNYDTTPVQISGWTTSSTNFIKIFTPTTKAEVGESQRHNGVWRDSAYTLHITNSVAIVNSVSFVKIEGIQILLTINVLGSGKGGITNNGQPGGDVSISHNILKSDTTGTTSSFSGITTGSSSNDTSILRVWDNIVYDFYNKSDPTLAINGIYGGSGIYYYYNNTTYSCNIGFGFGSGTVTRVLRNNLSYNDIVNSNFKDYSFPGGHVSSNNISSDATSPNAAFTLMTVLFNDESTRNLSLNENDSAALGAGLDLSNDPLNPFLDNIVGTFWDSSWNIGAH